MTIGGGEFKKARPGIAGSDALRVLIVDDDRFLAESLSDVLSGEAADVSICRTGREAIEAVRSSPVGIALIDVRLPDMGGIELLKRLKELVPDLDIVIVTGNASVHSAIEALNSGASRYILKPCVPDELISIVFDLWERQRLRERNRQYLRRLEVHNALSEAVSSAMAPEDVARAAVEATLGLTEVKAAAVLARPETAHGLEKGDVLRPLAWTGMAPETAGRLAMDPTVIAFMSDKQSPMYPRGMMLLRPDEGHELGVNHPVALYRLKSRAQQLGLLAVVIAWDSVPHDPNEELLTAIANWIAVALERAMLYRRLELAYSEVKSAQKQLVYAEKQSAIGRLAAGLAHEVGTPLNIISGRAEFLLETSTIDPETRRGLQVIVDQIERISGLIRQLLDFSREQRPSRVEVALAGVLDAVLPLLEVQIRKRKIKLVVDVPDDLPAVVANPNQLQQVFINLLMNSMDAIKAQKHSKQQHRKPVGRILVQAEYLPDRREVQVVVADSGQGIREEHIDKVFEPFFTTKEVGTGTGLGLAVVYGIVTDHGGTIDIESSWSKGTAVTFTLPAVEKHSP